MTVARHETEQLPGGVKTRFRLQIHIDMHGTERRSGVGRELQNREDGPQKKAIALRTPVAQHRRWKW